MQVTHYFFENCKYYTPMHSTPGKLAYRKPEWIKPGEWQPARQPDPDVVASMSPLARKIAALRRRLGF